MRVIVLLVLAFAAVAGDKKPELSALDRYIAAASGNSQAARSQSNGSLWSDAGTLADLARDFRAYRIDDAVTIVIAERAEASARGDTQATRKSGASSGVSAVAGRHPAALGDLFRLSSESQLQGQGVTSRESTLATTLTARVAAVLPNGYLVVEGAKETLINSERQTVTLRGVARPEDIGSGNLVRSERLAQVEIRINGKGVVSDAVRRPNFLYRLLLGVLPF
jgi:flagellar L-ring protein precursor FlgH